MKIGNWDLDHIWESRACVRKESYHAKCIVSQKRRYASGKGVQANVGDLRRTPREAFQGKSERRGLEKTSDCNDETVKQRDGSESHNKARIKFQPRTTMIRRITMLRRFQQPPWFFFPRSFELVQYKEKRQLWLWKELPAFLFPPHWISCTARESSRKSSERRMAKVFSSTHTHSKLYTDSFSWIARKPQFIVSATRKTKTKMDEIRTSFE